MITTSDAPHDGNRGLRIALVASVIVHVLLGLLALVAYDGTRHLLARIPVPQRVRRPQDEVVTISSALHLEKRARPVPVSPQRAAPRPGVRATQPHLARRPQAAQQPRPPAQINIAKPVYQAPALLRHELAKSAPQAPKQAARSKRGRQSAAPDRTSPPQPAAARQLASIEHARGRDAQRTPPTSHALSDQRLAQIEGDLAKTIAQARAQVNPLRSTPREPPAAPKHYRIQMQGQFGDLRRGEGYYFPIKAWRSGGLDYYFVSYEFTYPDGTYETGSVPWPIHFAPRADPFAREDLGLLHRTPLPPPALDYMPPGTLGKALRPYFPNLRFSDSG